MMQEDSMWSMFTQTGEIEYYLIYKAESENETGAKQCSDTIQTHQ